MSEGNNNKACKIAAVVVAAGRGRRMGAEKNKLFLPLAGRPILAWTLERLVEQPEVGTIVLVIAPEDRAYTQGLVEGLGWSHRLKIVDGGAERIDSVRNGLETLESHWQWVAVHDGARPLFTPELFSRCIQKAQEHGSAVAAVPVKDTIKEADLSGLIEATPSRDRLWAVQTPQIFPQATLKAAYQSIDAQRKAGSQLLPTDDAMVMEMAGHQVYLAPGHYENIKITTPDDLIVAEAILAKQLQEQTSKTMSAQLLEKPSVREAANVSHDAKPDIRVGMGYDVHKLVPDRALILGGVQIPYTKGLLGHSDADVLLHAIKDALLGASGLGDIGRHFPDSDQQYKGASSMKLLAIVNQRLQEKGFVPHNIDATVVAQRPKLASYIPEMNRNIAEILGLPLEQVNVKATTTEGLGFTGTGEGIAAYAAVTIKRDMQKDTI